LQNADISQNFHDPPSRPLLARYPAKIQCGARHSFQSAWYDQHEWIEYSQQADAIFCYACRHFSVSGMVDKAFTSTGFCNWKKAQYKDAGLTSHAMSDCHIQAFIALQDYKIKDTSKSVLNQLTDERARQIKENQYYISVVVNALKYTAVHKLAQRGHCEIPDSINAGNFVDLMKLIGQYNDTVGKKFDRLDTQCQV